MNTLRSFSPQLRVAVIGASGGIGTALVKILAQHPSVATVYALSRTPCSIVSPKVVHGEIDVLDEDSVQKCANLAASDAPLDIVIVATGILWSGEALRPEQGYPVRLVNPGWEGNTSVKWLRRLEVGAKPWHHREETSKYTDLMADGTARRFTYVQECNSVVTTPSPENPFRQKGRYQIEGLAWSGRGRIRHVDVSLDGGVTWREARFTSEVLPRALTRFALDWDWDGSPAMVQSRAVDETGYVQPTYGQLRSARGTNSIYHKNAIHTWKLSSDGTVSNVQIS